MALQCADSAHYFVLLFLWDLEFVEGFRQVCCRDVPVRISDMQAGVGRLHILAGVDARAASRCVEKINDMRLDRGFRGVVQAGKELGE